MYLLTTLLCILFLLQEKDTRYLSDLIYNNSCSDCLRMLAAAVNQMLEELNRNVRCSVEIENSLAVLLLFWFDICLEKMYPARNLLVITKVEGIEGF